MIYCDIEFAVQSTYKIRIPIFDRDVIDDVEEHIKNVAKEERIRLLEMQNEEREPKIITERNEVVEMTSDFRVFLTPEGEYKAIQAIESEYANDEDDPNNSQSINDEDYSRFDDNESNPAYLRPRLYLSR